MATKETFRTRLARVRADVVRTGQLVLEGPVLSGTAQGAIHFLLGAVLAGSKVFGSCAPFGVALVGGSGSGVFAAMALLGSTFGYLVLMGLVEGLRYVSAGILTFSLAFAFYDVKLYRMPWTMPVAAALMNACTGFIYLSQQGWRTPDVIYYTTEVALTAVAAYAFREVLDAERRTHSRWWVLLVGAVYIALSYRYLYADVSLGRCLAALTVLACGWQGGVGIGAGMGVALGLSMDLAAPGNVVYTMSFGAAGLVCGLTKEKKRWLAALAFLATGVGAVLWLWDRGLPLSLVPELVLGTVCFLLLPGQLLRRFGGWLLAEGSKREELCASAYVRQRLEQISQAFSELGQSLRGLFCRPRYNDEDPAVVFDRAAERVCRSCSRRDSCWERDYVTTVNALNDATASMLRRGRGEPEDFPEHFRGRCLHFDAFLSGVNEELTARRYRRQYDHRIRDSRKAVCRQYGQLAHILACAAAELGEELTCDPIRERRLRQHMALLGVEGDAAVFYDRDHHLRVEVVSRESRRLERELDSLTGLMGVPMRKEPCQEEQRLVLVQCEPYMMLAGVAARCRDGQTVSGDCGTWFKRGDGMLYVLLCDGMGSGAQAGRESGLAVRLLEQFLRARMEPEAALEVLCDALGVRGEEEGSFTTVDLLQVNLFSGEGAVYKLGAAPTYLKKNGVVRRITGTTMPAGMLQEKADCTRFRLEEGDCVVMVSDGVSAEQGDDFVCGALERFDGQSPRELAEQLVPQTKQADDRTAVVLRLTARVQGQEKRENLLTKTENS